MTKIEPLDRLVTREISPRYLLEEVRRRVADLLPKRLSASQIISELSSAVSTISKELRCGAYATSDYRLFDVDALASGHRHLPKELKDITHHELAAMSESKHRDRLILLQISRHLPATCTDDANMRLSH